MNPEAAMPANRAAVLAAIQREHAETGRATVRSIMARTGLTSTASVHGHVVALQRDGLVQSEFGKVGTLRPTFRLWSIEP